MLCIVVYSLFRDYKRAMDQSYTFTAIHTHTQAEQMRPANTVRMVHSQVYADDAVDWQKLNL